MSARGRYATSRDIYGCHNGRRENFVLEPNGSRPGILLNISQCTGHLPPQRIIWLRVLVLPRMRTPEHRNPAQVTGCWGPNLLPIHTEDEPRASAWHGGVSSPQHFARDAGDVFSKSLSERNVKANKNMVLPG